MYFTTRVGPCDTTVIWCYDVIYLATLNSMRYPPLIEKVRQPKYNHRTSDLYVRGRAREAMMIDESVCAADHERSLRHSAAVAV